MEVKKFVSTDVRVSACKKNYHCTKAGHSIYYEGKNPHGLRDHGNSFLSGSYRFSIILQ